MKDRGKALETFKNDWFVDYTNSSSDFPCRKHPSGSSVGVCAYCLKDRLIKLVCSDCGEQRLSSCSCSEISSNRDSGNVEVGSVGRISFLIENEKGEVSKLEKTEVLMLKRSNSSCVEIKKSGIWRIGKFFKRNKEKGNGNDEKSEMWVGDEMGVCRSRSLCSFKGSGLFGLYGSEDGAEYLPNSAARSSISAARSSISAARSSGVTGGLVFESERKSGFSETEPRKSGFSESDPRKSGFDCDLKFDSSGFIDLKFDSSSSDAKTEYSVFGSMRCEENSIGRIGDGILNHGKSCRVSVNERGIKRSRKSFKGWRWMFRNHSNSRKKVEDLIFSPSCYGETVKTN